MNKRELSDSVLPPNKEAVEAYRNGAGAISRARPNPKLPQRKSEPEPEEDDHDDATPRAASGQASDRLLVEIEMLKGQLAQAKAEPLRVELLYAIGVRESLLAHPYFHSVVAKQIVRA